MRKVHKGLIISLAIIGVLITAGFLSWQFYFKPQWEFEQWLQDIPQSFTVSTDAGHPDTDGNFTLMWTVSENADDYRIYYYPTPNSSSVMIGTTNLTFWEFHNMGEGTHYFNVGASNQYATRIFNSNLIEVIVELE